MSQDAFRSPYSAQSPWRAKPQNVTFGAGTIPVTTNFPAVQDNSPVIYARSTDPSMAVAVAGIQDEGGAGRTVTIPHFPSDVFEVPGDPNTADKEMTIFDSSTNLLHQFWSFQHNGPNGTWTAASYACESAIDNNPAWGGGASQGLGFGTPARPYSIRAAGTGPAAGMLRLWELFNSDDTYPQHALLMGLDSRSVLQNTATSGPPPIAPATCQDANFPYTGVAPNAWSIGQLFMLPPTFNLSQLSEAGSILVAQTLMTYGAFLVDTGPGAQAFVSELYFTNKNSRLGKSQSFFPNGGSLYSAWSGAPTSSIPFFDSLWSGSTARYGPDGSFLDTTDLKTIQAAMKPVASVGSWLDANGNPFTPTKWKDMNLLSMRGPYTALSGTPPATAGYFTDQHAYVVPTGSAAFTVQTLRFSAAAVQTNVWVQPSVNGPWWDWHDPTGNATGWFHTSYALAEGDPIPNRSYTLKAFGSGNLTAKIILADPTQATTYFTSNALAVGQSQTFAWPNQAQTCTQIQVTNPASGGGKIRLELVGN